MSEKRKGILKLVILAVLLAGAQILLKEDGKVFAIWWLAVLLLGWCSFPLCQYLFSGFRDKGYLVAKNLRYRQCWISDVAGSCYRDRAVYSGKLSWQCCGICCDLLGRMDYFQ